MAFEKGLIRTDSGEFKDRGNAVLNVLHPDYGAKYTDGYVNNGATCFDNALDDLITNFSGRGILMAPPGSDIRFTTPHTIPVATLGEGTFVRYDLHGVQMRATSGTGIFSRLPTSNDNAALGIGGRIVISGGYWVGDATTSGQIGIRIGATYGSVFKDMLMTGFDTALQAEYCLLGRAISVRTHNCGTQNLVARRGSWNLATAANSASNHFKFEQCRTYGKEAATSQYYILGSSGVVLDSCIAEGEDTVDNVHFDAEGQTTMKWFEIRNLHSENVPTGAVVRLKAVGRVRLRGIFTQSDAVIVDSNGSGDSLIILEDIPWNVATTPFKCTSAGSERWFWNGAFDQSGQVDPFATALWVAGTIPEQRAAIRPSTSAEIATGMGLTLEGGHGIYLKGTLTQSGIESHASIQTTQLGSGTVNEHNPSTAVFLRLDPHLGIVSLTGISGGSAGRVLRISNVNATNNLILKNDVTSTAAMRFLTPNAADYTMTPGSGCTLWYDSTSSRWRVLDN